MKRVNIVGLITCLAIPLAIGTISGIATATSIKGWYAALDKPAFNPPNFIFGPVWTLLYILMGISLYIIWRSERTNERTNALRIFGIQLVLNFAWSFIFFYFHQVFIALLEIVMIWVGVLLMIIIFRKVSRTAAYLQIPYLMWVSFASLLNAAIWILNQ
jgi:benzodiazapine receptor